MNRISRKRICAAVILLALLIPLAACGDSGKKNTPPENGSDASQDASHAESPPYGSNNPANPDGTTSPGPYTPSALSEAPLRVAWRTPCRTIDPHYAATDAEHALADLLYESFYYIDKKGNEYPRLAESYEVSSDGMEYTYHLKRGVKWQTGEDFTSEDVLYSLDRAQASPLMAGYMASVAFYDAPDEHTVVFDLYDENPNFHFEINHIRFLGEEATSYLEDGFDSGIPGGTGPYTLPFPVTDRSFVFYRNDFYHGEPAPIGNIVVTVYREVIAAVSALETGECDYAAVDGDNWERLRDTGKYNTYIENTPTVRFLAMNNDCDPFDEPLVRQAINCAINKEDFINSVVGGYGIPATYLANPEFDAALPGFDDIPSYSYTPDRARRYLDEAGYEDGLEIYDPIIVAEEEESIAAAHNLQEQLAAVGIEIEIEIADPETFAEDFILGDYAIGIPPASLSPDITLIANAYMTEGVDYLNLARYSNDEVDEFFELGLSSPDAEERFTNFRRALNLASREAAYLPLYVLKATIVTVPGLHSTSYQSLYYWYWN